MRFLFDTDLLSILQWKSGDAFARLTTRIARFQMDDFAVSIVTLHEQTIGAHAFIQAARTGSDLERGYRMLLDNLEQFSQSQVVLFDADSEDIVRRLRKQRVRIGTIDLRIAATALQYNLTLLTRNAVDFSKVPGLTFEDWTTP